MKKTLTLLILFVFIAASFAVDCNSLPTLFERRRCAAADFNTATDDSLTLALANQTAYADPNNSTFCVDVTGCYANEELLDYLAVVFVEVPVQVNGTVEFVRFTITKTKNYLHTFEALPDVCADCFILLSYINVTQLNFVTGAPDFADGIFYENFFEFAPNSSDIRSKVSISNIGGQFFESATGVVTPQQVCAQVVGAPGVPAACPINSSNEVFASFNSCITAYEEVVNTSFGCPDELTSNTTACRNIHVTASRALPPNSTIIHCPHTAVPSGSSVCDDRCEPVCKDCDANAHCVFTPDPRGTRIYSCECDEGYVGNGTSCVIKNCSAQYECDIGGQYNFVKCNSSCGCQPTFTWNQTSGGCDCDGNVVYINGTATCLAVGACTERYHCSSVHELADYTQVQCLKFGTNDFVETKTCVSNYGYDGDGPVPVICAAGKREEWNTAINGRVCLFTDECTATSQCSGLVCDLSQPVYPGVGKCV